MVGWLPKLIYTQTNIAVAFLLLWIWQVYDNWYSLNIYIPTTLTGYMDGAWGFLALHWPLLLFLVELATCRFILHRAASSVNAITIKAISTDNVSMVDIGTLFTILPVVASFFGDKISLSFVYMIIGLLLYELYAFKRGCSNLTVFLLGYREYNIESSDKMHHRILSKDKLRKGDDVHRVIEFNDIYLKIED